MTTHYSGDSVQPLSLQNVEILLKAILELIVTLWPVQAQMIPSGFAKLDCAEQQQKMKPLLKTRLHSTLL